MEQHSSVKHKLHRRVHPRQLSANGGDILIEHHAGKPPLLHLSRKQLAVFCENSVFSRQVERILKPGAANPGLPDRGSANCNFRLTESDLTKTGNWLPLCKPVDHKIGIGGCRQRGLRAHEQSCMTRPPGVCRKKSVQLEKTGPAASIE